MVANITSVLIGRGNLDTDIAHTEGRPCEDRVRGRPPKSQGERPQNETNLHLGFLTSRTRRK
jgi:hypothetical protein